MLIGYFGSGFCAPRRIILPLRACAQLLKRQLQRPSDRLDLASRKSDIARAARTRQRPLTIISFPSAGLNFTPASLLNITQSMQPFGSFSVKYRCPDRDAG